MASSATIPVRVHQALLEQLDRYAARLGVSRNAAIKLCLANQFGMITSLQPGELLNLDGRSLRHRQGNGGVASEGDGETRDGVSTRLESEIKQAREAKQRATKKDQPSRQPWP